MLLYFTLIIATFLFYHLYWKRTTLPPGPLPLPFIGNFLQFWYYGIEEALVKFKDDFGDLHTLWLGDTPVVSLNDFPTIYQEFVKNGDAYSGRDPKDLFLKFLKNGNFGIAFIDGPLWHDQRRFGLRVLRDLGVGKDVMQRKVLHEVTCLLEEVKADLGFNNHVIDLQALIDRAIGSVINSIVLGYRIDKVCH